MNNGILGLQPNDGRESEKCIIGLVRTTLAQQIRKPVSEINMETQIADELVPKVLAEVGEIIDRVIPSRGRPRHGWKVSTLVGYIFNEQDKFPIRKAA